MVRKDPNKPYSPKAIKMMEKYGPDYFKNCGRAGGKNVTPAVLRTRHCGGDANLARHGVELFRAMWKKRYEAQLRKHQGFTEKIPSITCPECLHKHTLEDTLTPQVFLCRSCGQEIIYIPH